MVNIGAISPEFVANISSNIFIQVTKSGKILFFNTKANCVLGKVVVGCNLEEIIPKSSSCILLQNIKISFYHQYPHHFYWGFKNRFYLVYVYPQDSSVWLCFDDITEKRQLAHLLHMNNQRTLFAERLAKLGYWELDIETKRFYWSDEVYNIFGITEKDKTYKKNLIREFVHPNDLALYKQKLKELVSIGNEVDGIIRILTADNITKYCKFVAGFIYENGEPKIAGIFQDISMLIGEQKQLKQAKTKADKLNAEKSYFLAQASHDIRQPLQAINLFAEGLKSAPLEKYPEIADNILIVSRNLNVLLNNVLDISKLDAGGICFNPTEFDLGKLLAKFCDEYGIIMQETEISLACNIKNVIVRQDVVLLERIIRNLLSNAIKYAKSKIKIGNSKNCFWIIDDGCGIDKNNKKHIFEPFYQCNTLRDRAIGGTGLGLNIVKKIATAIGADIKVKSKLNSYTIFKVCL